MNVQEVACVSKRELRESTVNSKGQNLINLLDLFFFKYNLPAKQAIENEDAKNFLIH